jgi:hypothetical protein
MTASKVEVRKAEVDSSASCGLGSVVGLFEDGDAVCDDSVAAIDGIGDGEGLAVG